MYITSRHELSDAVDRDLIQDFRHKLLSKTYGSDNKIMEMYENKRLDDTDVKIAHFLYENRMATFDQLSTEFSSIVNDAENLRSRLDIMVNEHIVDFFSLKDRDTPADTFYPHDVLKIYTFDFAGITLLSHFYDDLDLLNWNCRSLLLPGKYVKRLLLATDWRVALDTRLATPVLSYDPYRLIGFGRFRIVPQAEIMFSKQTVADGVQRIPFVMLTCIEEDMVWVDKTRLSELLGRYEEWFQREAWRTYFQTAPGCFIICDKESTRNYVQDLVKDINIHENRERKEGEEKPSALFSDKVRVTDADLFTSDLESCMYRYSPEKGRWVRVRIGLLKEQQ